MNAFEKLKEVALQQSLSAEFPSWLLASAMAVAERPQRYAEKGDLVERLVDQIGEYDPYAGAGCFGSSVSAAAIEATLREITS